MPITSSDSDLSAAVSRENLVHTMAGIARWVRLSGTEEERQAFDYVHGLLDSFGLETELILHDAYISLPGPASLELPRGDRLPCITHSFAAPTGLEGVAGSLVHWSDSPEGLTGQIALVDGLAMPGRVLEVEAAGAIAAIFISGELTHEMIVSPVWGNPDTRTRSLLPGIPVVSVDTKTGERLGRAVGEGTPTIRMRAEVDTGWRRTPILVANLPATGSEEFVLFSGHLDSWHYGAMDNGSANAAMVEVGRLMALHRDRLRRGLRLAFWSGHSHGRYSGSAWYADNHWLELREHCVAHVNVDSLGGRGATVLSEGIAMASTRALGAGAIHDIAGEVFHGSRVGRAGDQSFVGLGIPSLWMSLSEQPPSHDATADAFAQLVGESRSGGLGWWWHTTEDTVDKIDPELLLRDARIYALAVHRLLTERLLPLDPAAEAHELLAQLRELPASAIDLSAVLALAEEVARKAESLQNWRQRKGERVTDDESHAFNRAVTGMSREVISVAYTMAGPHGHDPALTLRAVPGLAKLHELAALEPASDDARFLAVELTQARNRVADALQRALAVPLPHDPEA